MTDTGSEIESANGTRIERAEANLDRLIGWVGHHDTKASVILGITTTMAGVLGATAAKSATSAPAALVVSVITAGCFALIYLSLYMGSFPRIRGARRSPIYFGSIAATELDTYRAEMRGLDAMAYEDTLIDQCHVLARIVDTKFRWLTRAYRALFAAIPFWLVTLYLFLVG